MRKRFVLIMALSLIPTLTAVRSPAAGAKDYPRKPVPFTRVKVMDAFWAPRIETNRAVTIPFIFKKCEETGRIDNFAIAGGLMKGKYKGQRYNDTDVYKTIEGASYSLAVHPDAGLDAYLDALIAKIAAAQEPDGYLFTARTTDPTHPQPGIGAERWVEENVSHELYNAGHLYEAAAAHFQATGKRTLLDVACCPGNVARFIPSFPGYIYATEGNALYVNLFVGSTATVDLGTGPVTMRQETRYPWDGKVKITVEPEKESKFSVAVRIPGWALGRPMPGTLYRYDQEAGMAGAARTASTARNDEARDVERARVAVKTEAGAGTGDIAGSEREITLKVNGNPVALDTEKGFVRIRRTWKKGDTIDLDLPMPVHRVAAAAAVKDNAGRVAFERGPLVYCAEGVDNGGRALDLEVVGDSSFAAEFRPGLLNGVVVIKGKAADGRDLTLVPYYAWSNRGVGEMAVWIMKGYPDR